MYNQITYEYNLRSCLMKVVVVKIPPVEQLKGIQVVTVIFIDIHKINKYIFTEIALQEMRLATERKVARTKISVFE